MHPDTVLHREKVLSHLFAHLPHTPYMPLSILAAGVNILSVPILPVRGPNPSAPQCDE